MFSKLEFTSASQAKLNGNKFNLTKGYNGIRKITQLERQKREKLREYMEMYEAIKDSPKHSVNVTTFNNTLNTLLTLENDILSVSTKLMNINKQTLDRLKTVSYTIQTNLHNIHMIRDSQKAHHVNKKDVETVIRILRENINLYKESSSLFLSTFVVDEKGDELDQVQLDEEPQKPKKGRKPTTKKTQKATKEIVVSDVTNIKERVKDLIREKVFSFSDKQQCISRSKAVFMSKEQIIAAIEKYDDLKKLMPQNFKKLGKEELCSLLF